MRSRTQRMVLIALTSVFGLGMNRLALAAPTPASASASALTLAWEAAPRTIDPRYAVDANSQYLEDLLHCSLVGFDPEGALIGQVAKTWRWETPTRLTLELRADAHFADGTLVTAADAAATYNFFIAAPTATPSPMRGAFAKVRRVSAEGPTTLHFDLAEPDGTFVGNLFIGILPAGLAGHDLLTDKDRVNGCGPYRLAAFGPTALELVPNSAYTLGEPPAMARLIIKIVKDESTRFAKISAGELDIVQNSLNRDKLRAIAKGLVPGLKMLRRPGLNTTYLGFNMRDPSLVNPAVRQAIALAIDKEKIVKYVLNGMAVLADTLVPPSSPFHAENLPHAAYDPQRAIATLEAAGYKAGPSGTRLSLAIKTTTDLTRVAVAKAIAADLRKVGIDVRVETLEWGRFKGDVETGKVQLWTLQWVGVKDPDLYRFALATEAFPPAGGNRGRFSNAEFDRLVAQGRVETDPQKRRIIYGAAARLLAEQVPYVFLWHEDIFAVVSDRVTGFEVYADGRLSALSRTTKK